MTLSAITMTAPEAASPVQMYRATYSPDDNKLRLYAASRLDPEMYKKVHDAGFRWAPKQALFVAPAWTPGREDVLLSLAGEIEDEDSTLAERQEARAERFTGYSGKRASESAQALDEVERLAAMIPPGQPILVGHQLKYSDLASTAGYLSMMIPPLSWMMVRGLGAGFSSVYSHFASSAISPTASAAGSVVDGNYSYGNMQTENVNGFSWSTNSTTSFGQMMYQTGSGATATQTRDGNMVMDASGAMSRLPVGINATRQIAVAQQEMAREASNRAESALHGFSSSIASAWNTLSQFGSNRGSSDSVTSGADSTMSAQDSMMASRMRSAVESYAKAHNISNEQATQELASRSTRASAGMYGDAHAEWGVKPKILGVGGGLGVRGGGRAGIDWSDDDAHQASSGSRASYDARHDIDAKASKDFKEVSDYFTSRKVSESGSHTDNNADSRVDQLSAALNSAKQSYDQYTTNMTRSHEYAEMASRTESMSGQMSEDLSQQFAQYVMKHAPQDAEAILTNTSSPEIMGNIAGWVSCIQCSCAG